MEQGWSARRSFLCRSYIKVLISSRRHSAGNSTHMLMLCYSVHQEFIVALH